MATVYPKPGQAVPPVKVKVITRYGPTVLVEFYDGAGIQRTYIPAEALQRPPEGHQRSDEYLASRPDLGIPHGLPWAELIVLSATPEAIEKALHDRGIFTLDDLERDSVLALSAFTTVYAAELKKLVGLARNYHTRTHSSMPDEEV